MSRTRDRLRARLWRLAAGGALAALLAAGAWCAYSNPHGYQDTPPVSRIVTVPQGATLWLPRLGLEIETPADLPAELRPSDRIRVTRDGYMPWEGRLEDLPQIARKTYKLELQPLPDAGERARAE